MFDQHLSTETQIKSIRRSAYFHIRNINTIRHLTPSAAAQLMHSLVTLCLDYCNALLHRVPEYRIRPLQRMQNIAARVFAVCSRCNIKPIFKELHWLPVKERIVFKMLLLVYKSKNNLSPEYKRNICIRYKKDFSSRSNHLDLLDPGQKSSLKTYRDSTFKIVGAKKWNKLPLNLRRF